MMSIGGESIDEISPTKRKLISDDRGNFSYSRTIDNFGKFQRHSSINEIGKDDVISDSTQENFSKPKKEQKIYSLKSHRSLKPLRNIIPRLGKWTTFDNSFQTINTVNTTTPKKKYSLSDVTKYELRHSKETDLFDAVISSKCFNNKELEDREQKFFDHLRECESKGENENLTAMLYAQIQGIELMNAFFTFLAIISAIFAQEFDTMITDANESKIKYHVASLQVANDVCLAIVSISILFFIVIVIFRYIINWRILKSTKLVMRQNSFFCSGGFIALICEILLALIHPNLLFKNYKFITNEEWYLVAVPYSANDYLTIFIIFRSFILCRCILISTEFYSVRVHRVHKMFGGDLNVMFVLKSLYKSYPYRFITYYSIIVTTLMAYILRIVEGPVWLVRKDVRDSLNDFRSYENCIWNTFVTMATVGYGDYYQVTNLGRLITVINSLLGSILVSLTIVTIQNSFLIGENENKALLQLDRLKDRHEIEVTSVSQVRAVWDYIKIKNKLINALKDKKSNTKEIKQLQRNLKDAIHRRIYHKQTLKKLLHNFHNVYQLPTNFDDVLEHIEYVDNFTADLDKKMDENLASIKNINEYLNMNNLKCHNKRNSESCCNCSCHNCYE